MALSGLTSKLAKRDSNVRLMCPCFTFSEAGAGNDAIGDKSEVGPCSGRNVKKYLLRARVFSTFAKVTLLSHNRCFGHF